MSSTTAARQSISSNELEYIKGEIWSNVWHSDRIARISPKDGRVLGWVDLTGILPASQKVDAESVLNGIAYDAEKDRIFVTGKQWARHLRDQGRSEKVTALHYACAMRVVDVQVQYREGMLRCRRLRRFQQLAFQHRWRRRNMGSAQG